MNGEPLPPNIIHKPIDSFDESGRLKDVDITIVPTSASQPQESIVKDEPGEFVAPRVQAPQIRAPSPRSVAVEVVQVEEEEAAQEVRIRAADIPYPNEVSVTLYCISCTFLHM